MKKVLQTAIVALIMILLVALGIFGYLCVDEFKPRPVEALGIEGEGHNMVKKDESIRMMTWNLGYGALGDNADFFMDGGKMVNTADEERVKFNLDKDIEAFEKFDPDILCLQELDRNSARSSFIDEAEYFSKHSSLNVFNGAFSYAINYKVSFVPLPVPPIGKVEGGLAFFTDYELTSAERLSLPCPFKWPLRIINLKRCLQQVRLPIEDSDKELVIFNLHLEAYDDGEGKIAQTKVLKEVLRQELDKGNYVIAVGDFNQCFSNIDVSAYPLQDGDIWLPGVIEVEDFDDRLEFIADPSAPTARSLDRAYATAESHDPKDFQVYVIDGFVVSEGIEVEKVFTDDLDFVSSDHNPVVLDFKLK